MLGDDGEGVLDRQTDNRKDGQIGTDDGECATDRQTDKRIDKQCRKYDGQIDREPDS